MLIVHHTKIMLLWLTTFSRALSAKSDGFAVAALVVPLIRPVFIVCSTWMVSTVINMCKIKDNTTHPTRNITQSPPSTDPPVHFPPVKPFFVHTIEQEFLKVEGSVWDMPGYDVAVEVYEDFGFFAHLYSVLCVLRIQREECVTIRAPLQHILRLMVNEHLISFLHEQSRLEFVFAICKLFYLVYGQEGG